MADTNETERKAAEERLSARKRLFERGVEFAKLGASAGRVAVGGGLRASMPLLESYSGLRVADVKVPDSTDADGEPLPEETGIFDLTPAQVRVVTEAGKKAVTELIEITSVTHPVYEGAPAYMAVGPEGNRQTPHLQHLFALVSAGRDYFGFDDDEVPEPDVDQPIAFREDQAVAFLAVAPGEFAASPGPLTPTETRRSAMRLNTFSQPEPAILANNNQPISQPLAMSAPATGGQGVEIVPLSSVGMAQTNRALAYRGGRYAAPQMSAPASGCGCGGSSGCSCGGSGGSCGCGGHGRFTFSPPRYNIDGTCASTAAISCDTKWRVRECFKIAICDMLRCVAEAYCDDSETDDDDQFERCLEGFLCSLLRCLPDAICPPPEKEICCPPAQDPSCNCNFAVGD